MNIKIFMFMTILLSVHFSSYASSYHPQQSTAPSLSERDRQTPSQPRQMPSAPQSHGQPNSQQPPSQRFGSPTALDDGRYSPDSFDYQHVDLTASLMLASNTSNTAHHHRPPGSPSSSIPANYASHYSAAATGARAGCPPGSYTEVRDRNGTVLHRVPVVPPSSRPYSPSNPNSPRSSYAYSPPSSLSSAYPCYPPESSHGDVPHYPHYMSDGSVIYRTKPQTSSGPTHATSNSQRSSYNSSASSSLSSSSSSAGSHTRQGDYTALSSGPIPGEQNIDGNQNCKVPLDRLSASIHSSPSTPPTSCDRSQTSTGTSNYQFALPSKRTLGILAFTTVAVIAASVKAKGSGKN